MVAYVAAKYAVHDQRFLDGICELLTIINLASGFSKVSAPAFDQVDFVDAETGCGSHVDGAVEVMWVVHNLKRLWRVS